MHVWNIRLNAVLCWKCCAAQQHSGKCCSALQHFRKCCAALQHYRKCCAALHPIRKCCAALQHFLEHYSTSESAMLHFPKVLFLATALLKIMCWTAPLPTVLFYTAALPTVLFGYGEGIFPRQALPVAGSHLEFWEIRLLIFVGYDCNILFVCMPSFDGVCKWFQVVLVSYFRNCSKHMI